MVPSTSTSGNAGDHGVGGRHGGASVTMDGAFNRG